MSSEREQEHRWLDRLVGEWTYESEMVMGPGQPPARTTGTESVRSLGGLWVVCEGQGEVPGGGTGTTIMTLGYDPLKKWYIGTFIGSMMTHLWIYQGVLDAAGKVLTLDTEGPSFTGPERMAKYKDMIEFVSDDHRVLTSRCLAGDGEWHKIMKATYRRTKQAPLR